MQIKFIFLFKKFVLPLTKLKYSIMDILKMLQKVCLNSDEYFVFKQSDLDTTIINQAIQNYLLLDVITKTHNGYVIIFNKQIKTKLEKVIHLQIDELKKDSV